MAIPKPAVFGFSFEERYLVLAVGGERQLRTGAVGGPDHTAVKTGDIPPSLLAIMVVLWRIVGVGVISLITDDKVIEPEIDAV